MVEDGSGAGGLDGLGLLRRELLVAPPRGDRLGVGAGLGAAVDRGEHHAVAKNKLEKQSLQLAADPALNMSNVIQRHFQTSLKVRSSLPPRILICAFKK